nr:MAG TPA_asm: hypothetical protein [Caudoviricetes sp.]
MTALFELLYVTIESRLSLMHFCTLALRIRLNPTLLH